MKNSVLVLLLLASRVWAGMPPYAEESPRTENVFTVMQGFPHPEREKALYDAENARVVRAIAKRQPIPDGMCGSYDEFFYIKPLAVSSADAKEIRRLLKKARLARPGEKTPEGESYPRQAEYKVLWSEDGSVCNLHLYVRFHAITQFLGGDSTGRPLVLETTAFDQLAKILQRYKIEHPVPTGS